MEVLVLLILFTVFNDVSPHSRLKFPEARFADYCGNVNDRPSDQFSCFGPCEMEFSSDQPVTTLERGGTVTYAWDRNK